MFDPGDHIPDPVHGMDGYDYVVCSCGYDSSDPKACGWLDHLPDSLDAAWAEAEAALPEGWEISSLHLVAPEEWRATANSTTDDEMRFLNGDGPSLAAALRALAAKLREVGR